MVCAYLQAFWVLPRISAMAPGFKDKIFRVKADEGLMLFTTLLHSLWHARSSKPQTELGSFKITTLSFVNLLSEHDEIIFTVYNMYILNPVEVLCRYLDELSKAIPAWFKPDPDTLKISRNQF